MNGPRQSRLDKTCSVPYFNAVGEVEHLLRQKKYKKKDYDWQYTFLAACKGGNLGILKMIIEVDKKYCNGKSLTNNVYIKGLCNIKRTDLPFFKFMLDKIVINEDNVEQLICYSCNTKVLSFATSVITKYVSANFYCSDEVWLKIFSNACLHSTSEIVEFISFLIPEHIVDTERLQYFESLCYNRSIYDPNRIKIVNYLSQNITIWHVKKMEIVMIEFMIPDLVKIMTDYITY